MALVFITAALLLAAMGIPKLSSMVGGVQPPASESVNKPGRGTS